MVLRNLIRYTVDGEDTLCAPSHPSWPLSGLLRTHQESETHLPCQEATRLGGRTHARELCSESVMSLGAFAQRGVGVRFTSHVFFIFFFRTEEAKAKVFPWDIVLH